MPARREPPPLAVPPPAFLDAGRKRESLARVRSALLRARRAPGPAPASPSTAPEPGVAAAAVPLPAASPAVNLLSRLLWNARQFRRDARGRFAKAAGGGGPVPAKPELPPGPAAGLPPGAVS